MMRSTGQSLSSKQGIAAGETIKKSLWDFKEAEESNQVVITEDMVFQAVMTRDFNSIKALQLIAKGINYFSGGQTVIRSMNNLQELNLAGNKLATLSNLENLRNLKSLNLNSNEIKEIPENFNLPALRTLNLDFNQIKKISNLKGVKKLESLSLAFNQIEDPSLHGSAFQLLDLETLNLGSNKISSIKHIIYGYPKV